MTRVRSTSVMEWPTVIGPLFCVLTLVLAAGEIQGWLEFWRISVLNTTLATSAGVIEITITTMIVALASMVALNHRSQGFLALVFSVITLYFIRYHFRGDMVWPGTFEYWQSKIAWLWDLPFLFGSIAGLALFRISYVTRRILSISETNWLKYSALAAGTVLLLAGISVFRCDILGMGNFSLFPPTRGEALLVLGAVMLSLTGIGFWSNLNA